MIRASDIPTRSSFRLANSSVPGCLLEPASTDELVRVDLDIANGRIAAVHPAGTTAPAPDSVDLDRSMVWPGLVDLHTHLDKGHIWPRTQNPDGTFMGAINAAAADRRRHWNAEDVARRMDFSLRCVYAHGTVAIRTHLNSEPPQDGISWPVFCDMRRRWTGRIHLQPVCLIALEKLVEPLATELADTVAQSNGVLGVVTDASPSLETDLRRVFSLARERGLDLNFHADESLNSESRSLDRIADLALDFPGKVHAGHCCSLAVQDNEIAATILHKLKAAGVSISSQPMCNLYLQDRQPQRTPRLRGVTLLHEMRACDIAVALASDNTRDPFYGYGDLDLLETFTQAVRIAHLDRPIGDWPAAVARTPAAIMGLEAEAGVIRAGAKADLIICEGRTFDEVLSRPQSRRIVLRDGQPIDATPPDYRELDDLF